MRTGPLLAAVFVFLLLGNTAARAEDCEKPETHILIITKSRELILCKEGKAARKYPVALGTGGVDKRIKGDSKTPLGQYPLGKPRPSKDFYIFIPIGYPTPEQVKKGYTGRDVGIHGPGRNFRLLGVLNTSVDWTLGCIAVGSDKEIDEIAKWVTANKVQFVVIR